MVNMSTEYLLFGVLIISALVAGVALLAKRIANKIAKIASIAFGGLIIVVAAVVMLTFFTVILNINTPMHYGTYTSPEGKKVVVMREWGDNPDLVDIRAEERWAENPDAVAGEYRTEDLGYRFFAAPRVLGMFYDKDRMSDGYLEIGASSEAKLAHSWEGKSLRLYIENPENGDTGESILNLK